MFGSTNPFGQSSASPFGQNSFGTQQGFGQATPAANNPFAPKPFGSPTTTFGAQTGSSLFGTTSTGAFGQQQSTPTFGTTSTASFGQQQSTPAFGTPSSSPFGSSPAFSASPTPAFGATSSTFGSGSLFGQKPSFGGFGSSPSQSSPFGGTFQQTQPTFGSSTFGASTTPAFGTTTTPAFGATTPAFGTTTTPAFGATTTPAFGSTSPSLFGASSTPAFGSSAPGFGTSATTAFGVSSSTTGFGSSSTPSFGTSTNAFSFGPSPSFGQTAVASGSSPFGTTSPFGVQTPAFGSQTTVPTFGQAQFCNQAGGTSIKLYAQTPDVDGATSVTQPAKLDSISAMPEYKDKSHEELRWEDYQRGDKGGSNPSGTPTVTPTSSTPPNTFTTNSAFNQTTPNPFSSNNPFAKNGSTSALLFNTSFNNTSVASLSPFTSSTSTTIFGQTGVSVFPASSSPSLFPNAAPTFASSSLFGTSTPNNSSLFGTGLSLANAQLAPPFQSFLAFTQQPSSTLAFSSGNLFRTLNTGSLFGSRPSLFTTPTYQQSAPAQTSSMFSFQPPPQPGGLPGFSNIANQALIGQQTSHYMVMQPAPVSNPFGTLPAMPQMSIGNGGSCSSVQYGILSLPVAEKPLPIRTLSVAVPRHLLQRRIKFLPRKYNPISDGKVPFFADDAESPATPKAGAFFIPRENPRNLIICPLEQWPSHSGINRQSVPKDSAGLDKYEDASTEKAVKSPRCSPLVENGKQHEPSHHGNGKGTSVKGLLPKLPQADYFTEPNLEELAAKERGEPGYCSLVEDFVVGRHGYGSIKFLGETDVRGLDLESVVEFNNREVIVYKDDSKKPPVGEGLNKAAEVTLLNIKCVNTKTGEEYPDGPQVDSYTQMLVRMTEEQGAEFVSFDAAMGEWKFRVEHFSTYGLWDVAGESEERRVLQKERDAESACQIKKIIWDVDTTSLFNHICSQEITQGNMEVGKLSVEILCEKLAKEGIQCTNYQIQNKWDDLKRLHSFWHNQVLGSKVKIKDEKFWKRVLKSRESKIEYRNLRHGPPQDIEYLDIMFGKKSAQNSSRRDQQLKKDPDCLQITVQELKEERENLKNDLEKVKEERENLKNDLKKVKEELKDEIGHLKELLDIKDSQIRDGEMLRKTLYNEIVELKGNMRVFCRVRPSLKSSEEAYHISYPRSAELIRRGIDITKEGRVNQFIYDQVFGPESTQEDVFEELSQLIECSINGYKVCIFTYGQTGSGKTYTMIGAPSGDKQGLIPRALKKIFDSIESQKSWIYTVNVSIGENYLNDLYDLLAPSHCKIQTAANLIEAAVTDIASAMVLLEEALRRRCVRATNMNDTSSRSHLVFVLKIFGSHEGTSESVQGSICFIDLAGSERNRKSGSEGLAQAEANAINASLLELNIVFTKIANKEEHISFRSSKLTSLLQPYLTGGSKTLMMVNISPDLSSIDETIFSLQYAQRVKDCMIGKPVRGGCVKEPTATTSREGGHSFFSPNKAVAPTRLRVPFSEMTYKNRASPRKHNPSMYMKQKKKLLVEGTEA